MDVPAVIACGCSISDQQSLLLLLHAACWCPPGGRDLMARHPGRYAQLLTIANDTVDMEIMRDLNRTFPNHVFFHQRQGPGQQSLFHVLRAFSSHDNSVGGGGAAAGV